MNLVECSGDRAVSSVIGVILMVAITVILAAVIAAWALGFGDTDDFAPNPTFETDYNSAANEIEIIVTGGESFKADRVSVTGNDHVPPVSETRLSDGQYLGHEGDTIVTAGDRFTVTLSDGDGTLGSAADRGVADGFDLQLVWTADDGETTTVLFETSGHDI